MSQSFILKRADSGAETSISTEIIAGRRADCGLVLPSDGLQGGCSRRHARLWVNAGALWVEDLASKNGTYLNDARLPSGQHTPVKVGDRLRFERIEFLVQAQAAQDASTLQRPSRQPSPARPTQPPPRQKTLRPSAGAVPPQEAPPEAPRQAPADRGAVRRTRIPGSTTGIPSSIPPGANWVAINAGSGTSRIPPKARERLLTDAEAAALRPFAQASLPSLRVLSGSLAGERFELLGTGGPRSAWTVGSHIDCDIVLMGDGVSSEHARIVNEGGRWEIYDQLARNGTYLNGQRTRHAYLSSGDQLLIGSIACVFELPGKTRVRRPEKPRNAGSWLYGALVLGIVAFAVWYFLPELKEQLPALARLTQ